MKLMTPIKEILCVTVVFLCIGLFPAMTETQKLYAAHVAVQQATDVPTLITPVAGAHHGHNQSTGRCAFTNVDSRGWRHQV